MSYSHFRSGKSAGVSGNVVEVELLVVQTLAQKLNSDVLLVGQKISTRKCALLSLALLLHTCLQNKPLPLQFQSDFAASFLVKLFLPFQLKQVIAEVRAAATSLCVPYVDNTNLQLHF